MITRRSFLEQLGRVGGRAAVLAAMNAFGVPWASAATAPPALRGSGKGKKVLVLGAGHSGNASAYELSKLGYEVTVLEARAFAGGRCQTARRGFKTQEMAGEALNCDFDEGQYLNIGPWRIPYHHYSTLHYTKEFNVPLEIMVNDNDASFLYSKSGKGPLAGKRVRQVEVKADMRGYAAEIVAKAAAGGKLDVPMTADDKGLLLEYLKHEGYLTKEYSYRGTEGRGFKVHPAAGLVKGEESEPYPFADVLDSKLWYFFNSVGEYDMQWTMFQPVGGMDGIARGFAKHMGQMIRYNTEVEQIRQTDKQVTAHWVDTTTGQRGATSADYMICTIPLSVLHRLDTDFSDEWHQAMEGLAYAPVLKTGLQMKRRFWEEDFQIYGGHIKSDHANNGYGFYTISLPSSGWQGKKGMLLAAYLFGDVAVETSALTQKGRIDAALDIGEEIFPGLYRASYDKGFSWCWHRAKYNQGGWGEWSKEGRTKHYPKLLEAQGRIYLAGEHMSYIGGWQAGAFESAWTTIEALHRRAQQA